MARAGLASTEMATYEEPCRQILVKEFQGNLPGPSPPRSPEGLVLPEEGLGSELQPFQG